MAEKEVAKGGASADLAAWQTRLVEMLRSDLVSPEAVAERPAAPASRREALAFDLGSETYAIGIDRVAEIIMPRPVTPLPRTPDYIRGVVSLRGTVLPVLDLGRRLGRPMGTTTRASRILVVRDADEWLGFWVERVRGVVRFAGDELQTKDFAAAADPRFLEGIGYDRRGTLVALLRADALCDVRLEAP